MKLDFGCLGVCVGGYTKESLYAFFANHNLEALIDNRYLSDSKPIDKDMYLRSESLGPYKDGNTLNIHKGFTHYITDMENFLHILRVGILDPDAANSLIEELNLQGLIKPREES